ncbi:MAG: cell division protein ZapA [bacterium]|nr:cell division protein ZapA [bacterium]
MAGGSDIVVIEILGTRLQLRGGDNPEMIQRAGELVSQQVDQIAAAAPTAPSLQIALLAALNLADELLRLGGDEEAVEAAADKATRILHKLSGSMK